MLSNILLHSNSGMNLYLASQGKDKLNSNNDYTMNKIMNISLGVNKYSISPYYTDNIGNIKLLQFQCAQEDRFQVSLFVVMLSHMCNSAKQGSNTQYLISDRFSPNSYNQQDVVQWQPLSQDKWSKDYRNQVYQPHNTIDRQVGNSDNRYIKVSNMVEDTDSTKTLRFQNLLNEVFDLRLKSCLKETDFAALPILNQVLQDEDTLEDYLFAQQIMKQLTSDIDQRNELISLSSKYAGSRYNSLAEVDNINSFTNDRLDKYFKELNNWITKPKNYRYLNQKREIIDDAIDEILQQEFGGTVCNQIEMEKIANDVTNYFTPGSMMNSKQQSKTEAMLDQFLDSKESIWQSIQQFKFQYTTISMIRKKEPKKTRPVCNTDKQSFILMQLFKNVMYTAVTPIAINHNMGVFQQSQWVQDQQKQQLVYSSNLDNSISLDQIFQFSLDMKNFDQHQAKYIIIRLFERVMVKFPVLEIVGKMIIDRLDKARIKFLNIDNKIEWQIWENGLPSGFPITSLWGSILNLAMIRMAQKMLSGDYTLDGRRIKQQTIRNRFNIMINGEVLTFPVLGVRKLTVYVNSDDTYLQTQLGYGLNILRTLQQWGLDYHYNQIISQNNFEFLRTLYSSQQATQYPMRLISKIVYKDPGRQEINIKEQVQKWKQQWQSLLTRMYKPYQIKRMAVLDLSGLLKLRYHTSLMIASNEQTEYNMLLGGSDISMKLEDDRPINSVDRIIDVGKISKQTAQGYILSDNKRVGGLTIMRNLLQEQRLLGKEKYIDNQVKIDIRTESGNGRIADYNHIPEYIKPDKLRRAQRLDVLTIINPQVSNEIFRQARTMGFNPDQVFKLFLDYQKVEMISHIYDSAIVKQFLIEGQQDKWLLLKIMIGDIGQVKINQIGSQRLWSFYHDTLIWKWYNARALSNRVLQGLRETKLLIGKLQLLFTPPFMYVNVRTST